MTQRNIERKLRRLMASGDLRRLARLREKLEKQLEHSRPRFRKSYAFEFWIERLLTEFIN